MAATEPPIYVVVCQNDKPHHIYGPDPDGPIVHEQYVRTATLENACKRAARRTRSELTPRASARNASYAAPWWRTDQGTEDMKIAPTPWTAAHDGHGGISLEDANGRQIGFVSARQEQESHAALLRAAPDLRAALEGLAATCAWMRAPGCPPSDYEKAAAAALARAVGAA